MTISKLAGFVSKLADDLYCGENTSEEFYNTWSVHVMTSLDTCGLRLSATKTIICPRSTSILGWIRTQGHLSASSHRVSVLSTCKLPDSAHCLRSFIVAYKILSCVLPSCAYAIAPQESAISGLQSKDKIKWSEELMKHFCTAQRKL